MNSFSADVLRLNAVLRLPPLVRKATCFGFQNACTCYDCAQRDKRGVKAERAPRQPWEARRAA